MNKKKTTDRLDKINSKNSQGKKSKKKELTPNEKAKLVIELLEEDHTVAGACRIVGISKTRFYQIKENDKEIQELHNEMPEIREGNMRHIYYKRAMSNKYIDGMLKWLERRSEVFKTKMDININEFDQEEFYEELKKINEEARKDQSTSKDNE